MRAYPAPGYASYLPAFAYGHSSTCWMPYYLHADGTLTEDMARENNAHIPFRREGQATLRADAHGIMGQASDALIFETAPLEHDLEVVGTIDAVLWISAGSLHHDFNFKLADVYPASPDYPNGFAMNLTDDLFRRRYPDPKDYVTPHKTNEIYRIRAEALPVSNIFRQGHRIRMTISSRIYPRVGYSPSSLGEAPYAGEEAERNRLYLDRQHASHIVLPIISHRAGY